MSKSALVLVLSLSIFTGCKSSSEFNSSSFLQKRKYTKGFHVNTHLSAKQKSEGHDPTIDVADEETIAEASKQIKGTPSVLASSYEPIASNSTSGFIESVPSVELPILPKSIQIDSIHLSSELV